MNKYLLSLAYLAYFTVIGIQITYLPAYYINKLGLSGKDVSLIYSVNMVMGVIAQPLWGQIADRTNKSGRLIRCFSVIAMVTYFILNHCSTLATILPCFVVLGFFMAGIPSLLDTIAMTRFAMKDYGKIRLGGSVGFGGSVLLYPIANKWHITPLEAGLGCVVFYFLSTLLVGEESRRHSKSQERLAFSKLLTSRPLLLFLLFATVYWCGQIPYNFVIDVHRANLNFPIEVTGIALLIGTIFEAYFMAQAGKWTQYTPHRRLFIFVSAIAALRWSIMIYSMNAYYFLALQTLHGITFGMFLTASIAYIRSIVPEELLATGQNLLYLSTFSLGGTIGTIIAGLLLDMPGKGFYVFAGATGFSLLACCISLGITRVETP